MEKASTSLAVLNFSSGKKEGHFLSYIDYFEKQKRWFFRGLVNLRSSSSDDKRDDIIIESITHKKPSLIIFNTSLSGPFCESCEKNCSSFTQCHSSAYQKVIHTQHEILKEDQLLYQKHPKTYERIKVDKEEMTNLSERDYYALFSDYSFQANPGLFSNEVKRACSFFQGDFSDQIIIGKYFKNRLKKTLRPYWSKEVDFEIASRFEESLQYYFNQSFDSYAQTSLMNLKRTNHLLSRLKHLKIETRQTDFRLILIEMLRNSILDPKTVKMLNDFDSAGLARLKVLKEIESNLSLFTYYDDHESIVKSKRAFENYIMSFSAIHFFRKEQFYDHEGDQFTYPTFR